MKRGAFSSYLTKTCKRLLQALEKPRGFTGCRETRCRMRPREEPDLDGTRPSSGCAKCRRPRGFNGADFCWFWRLAVDQRSGAFTPHGDTS